MYFKQRGKKRSNYHNKKTLVDGIEFASKSESKRYIELKALEQAGEIVGLELQVPYTLQEKFRDQDGKAVRKIEYICDFQYVEEGSNTIIVEDLKSKFTAKDPVYRLKKKLMIKKLQELEEITGVQYRFREVVR